MNPQFNFDPLLVFQIVKEPFWCWARDKCDCFANKTNWAKPYLWF